MAWIVELSKKAVKAVPILPDKVRKKISSFNVGN